MVLPDRDAAVLALTTGLGMFSQYGRLLSQREFWALDDHLRFLGLDMGALLGEPDLLETAPLTAEGRARARRCLQRADSVCLEYGMMHSMGARYVLCGAADYPARLHALGDDAPPALFYYGDIGLLAGDGIAVAGLRRADYRLRRVAWRIGALCAAEGLTVFSGGAYGIDAAAENENLLSGGRNVTILPSGFLANGNLRRRRPAVDARRQLLLCMYHPAAQFTAFGALYRNHVIYCLGGAAVTLAAGDGRGGSYAGAAANCKNGWTPQYVLDFPGMPPGNARLLGMGARPLQPRALYAKDATLRNMLSLSDKVE